MEKDIHSNENNKPTQVPLRSVPKAYFYCIVMCISAVYHGYCLTLIPATSSAQLRKYYNITLPLQFMLSLLNGIYPIGALVGCLIYPYIIGKTNKKNYFYFLLPFSVVATSLSIISSLESLLISRFMLGILTAFYTSLSTAYLKQTFHTDIKKPFGAIYSCSRFLGMLLCFIFAEIFHYAQDQIEHIPIFFGPSLLALIQACLLFFFVPHSPIDMINSKNEDLLYQNLSKFYHAKDIPIVIGQFKGRIVLGNRMTVTELGLKLVSRKNILSFHLSLLRQFCGITFIVVYIRQIMIDAKSPLADISPLIINSVQFGSGLIGIFMASRFKRKLLVRYSTLVITFLMVLVGVADLLDDSIFSLVMMTLFMVPCASCLLSVIWSYPSQLAHGSKGKYSSLISWSGTTVMLLVPPYVMNAMPGRAAYPIFFFCAIYLIFASVVNYFIIVEIGTITEIRSKKQIQLTNRSTLIS